MSRKLWIAGIIPALVLGLAIASALASSPADEKGPSLGRSGTPPTVMDTRASLDVPIALAGSEPIFVSDYFSFVGADEKGHVAFAIDNDRSRRGLKFTADAHVCLHDEHEDWIKVSGGGDYENKKKELLPIPDSADFQFLGEVKTGIILTSPNNQLQLTIDPMQERVSRIDNQSIYSMGSTSAT